MSVDEEENDEVAIDGEGEVIYDKRAQRKDYKLFSLRKNSCLNYHSLIDFDNAQPNLSQSMRIPNHKLVKT